VSGTCAFADTAQIGGLLKTPSSPQTDAAGRQHVHRHRDVARSV